MKEGGVRCVTEDKQGIAHKPLSLASCFPEDVPQRSEELRRPGQVFTRSWN